MKEVANAVAAGVITLAPGLQGQPTTPAMIGTAVPETPAARRDESQDSPKNIQVKRSIEEQDEEHEAKRTDTTISPRRAQDKRALTEEETEEPEKKHRSETRLPQEAMHSGSQLEASPSASPSSQLYPPYYAGLNRIEAHGDEEVGIEWIPDELLEEEFIDCAGDENDDPPEVSPEHLQRLDEEARETELNRMLEIPAMVETDENEVKSTGGYVISTKEVYCWKHRLEKGGWFRRARLVARQFRSIDIEQTFAPTSLMVLPKMLIHYLLNVRREFVVMTLGVKDAFLMAAQPEAEVAFVKVDNRIFKLLRCLPGQRTAAAQWFHLFSTTCIEYGMKQDLMQPTLLFIPGLLYLTVHVDDVFILGREDKVRNFVQHLKDDRKWNVEETGPFRQGSKFHYLKRQFNLGSNHCDVRCDRKQYDSFEKEVDLYSRFYRKTPLDSNFGKRDESEELKGEEVTKFRSIVGRLMYMSGERPDAQYAIQCLARHMSKPTKQALANAWHVVSYLFGTIGYGIRIDERKRGQSMMDLRIADEAEESEEHLLEIVTDAGYAGNKNDRKSTTSFQLFLYGNLMESKVRTQKAIALSSGESEFVAMVAGCFEGMLIRHLWNQITGQSCKTKVRSDSSAARGMTQRQGQGIGRVRHLDASLLWIQQKEKEKVITVSAIPAGLNSADIGAKNLARKRLSGLLYMIHMVDAVGDRVGEQEYHELEYNYQLKQGMNRLGKGRDLRIGLLLLLANMERSTAMSREGKPGSHFDFGWTLMCVCAL